MPWLPWIESGLYPIFWSISCFMTPLLTLPWPWDETQTQNVWIPTVRVEQKSTVTAAIDKSAAL